MGVSVVIDAESPSLSDCLAMIEPYRTHGYFSECQQAIRDTFDTRGPWEAAVKATEIADAFADIWFLKDQRVG